MQGPAILAPLKMYLSKAAGVNIYIADILPIYCLYIAILAPLKMYLYKAALVKIYVVDILPIYV